MMAPLTNESIAEFMASVMMAAAGSCRGEGVAEAEMHHEGEEGETGC